jgi:hypothetical protein
MASHKGNAMIGVILFFVIFFIVIAAIFVIFFCILIPALLEHGFQLEVFEATNNLFLLYEKNTESLQKSFLDDIRPRQFDMLQPETDWSAKYKDVESVSAILKKKKITLQEGNGERTG